MITSGGISFEHVTAKTDDEWSKLAPKIDGTSEAGAKGNPFDWNDLWQIPGARIFASTAAAALVAGGVYLSGNSGQVPDTDSEIPNDPEISYVYHRGGLSVLPIASLPSSTFVETPEDLRKAKIYEGIFLLPESLMSLRYRIYLEKTFQESPLSSKFMVDVNKLLEIASSYVDPEVNKYLNNALLYSKYLGTKPSEYPVTMSLFRDENNSRMVGFVIFRTPEGFVMSNREIGKNMLEVYSYLAQILSESMDVSTIGIESFRTALFCADQGVSYRGYQLSLGANGASAISEEQYNSMREIIGAWTTQP